MLTTLVGASGHVAAGGASGRAARILVGVATVLVLASALPNTLGGAAFAAGRASGGEIRASITGHYSASATSVAQNGSSETQTSSISWSATVSGSDNDILQGKALPKLTSLTGMVSASGGAGGGAACSGTLSAATQGLAQSDYQSLLVVYPPGYPAITAPGVGPQSNTTKQYLVEASLPQKFVVSSAGNDANSGCSTMLAQSFLNAGPPQGDPQYTAWQKTRHPWAYFDADGNSPAPTVTGNVSGTATGGGSYQSQAQETFTFGGGTGGTSTSSGSCSHPPTITANPSDVKANGHTTVAGCGFKHHSKVALVECLETSWIAPHKPCDTDNGVTVTTNASGGFRTAMKVDACRGVAPAGITEDCYIGVTKSTGVDTIALQPVVTIALNSP